jgi:hypothetical protein
MVASRDACPLCDKPFYGKQKFVRCGACETRINSVCLHLGEAEQAAISATGESVYKCDACAKSMGCTSNYKAPAKSPEYLRHNGATSYASSNEEIPLLISVSTQLEAIRNHGQCIIEFIQSLVNMITNLTKEVSDLKNDNTLLKQDIKNLHSLIEASPRPTPQYIKDRVFRSDSPPTRSRRSIGSGGESSSMLTSVEGNAVQAVSKGNHFLPHCVV